MTINGFDEAIRFLMAQVKSPATLPQRSSLRSYKPDVLRSVSPSAKALMSAERRRQSRLSGPEKEGPGFEDA